MLRWLALGIAVVASVACSTPSKPLQDVLPASIDGWSRTEIAPLEAASAPALITQLGLKAAVSATYTGPATVGVRVYEMNVATSAFELIQKWRQQDGLAVYSGPYFIVANPGPDLQASRLLEGLRKQLQ